MSRYPAHFEKFFSRLKNLREVPKGWECSCPVHESDHTVPCEPGRKPSMGVKLHDDGWLQPTCFRGCGKDEILRAIDCTLADIGPQRPDRVERFGRGKIERTYSYQDENGDELFQVVRFTPKDFRQRRADGRGGWLWSISDTRKVLYHLPELLANPSRMVFVVEGEKDVDALRQLGFLATCNPGGAGKWTDEYDQTLKGRAVVVIPDHDKIDSKTGKRPGWEHAVMVVKRLQRHAQWVRLLQLNIKEGKDISDWLAEGGTAEQLKALVGFTPNVSHPEAIPDYRPYGQQEATQAPTVRRVRKVKLTAEELSMAAHKGVMRHIWAIKGKDRSKDDYRAWSDKVELACAEQAAKKATHRYFVGAVGTHQDESEERLLHVKYHPTVHEQVSFTDDNGDDDLFVFVSGVAPYYSVHGWIRGLEAKLPERKGQDGRYLVPTSMLKDVRELPPELDGEGTDE